MSSQIDVGDFLEDTPDDHSRSRPPRRTAAKSASAAVTAQSKPANKRRREPHSDTSDEQDKVPDAGSGRPVQPSSSAASPDHEGEPTFQSEHPNLLQRLIVQELDTSRRLAERVGDSAKVVALNWAKQRLLEDQSTSVKEIFEQLPETVSGAEKSAILSKAYSLHKFHEAQWMADHPPRQERTSESHEAGAPAPKKRKLTEDRRTPSHLRNADTRNNDMNLDSDSDDISDDIPPEQLEKYGINVEEYRKSSTKQPAQPKAASSAKPAVASSSSSSSAAQPTSTSEPAPPTEAAAASLDDHEDSSPQLLPEQIKLGEIVASHLAKPNLLEPEIRMLKNLAALAQMPSPNPQQVTAIKQMVNDPAVMPKIMAHSVQQQQQEPSAPVPKKKKSSKPKKQSSKPKQQHPDEATTERLKRSRAPAAETSERSPSVSAPKAVPLSPTIDVSAPPSDTASLVGTAAAVLAQASAAIEELAIAKRRIAVLETQLRRTRERDICSVCSQRNIDLVILECGHACLCSECGHGLQRCPLCNTVVTRLARLVRM